MTPKRERTRRFQVMCSPRLEVTLAEAVYRQTGEGLSFGDEPQAEVGGVRL